MNYRRKQQNSLPLFPIAKVTSVHPMW